MKSWAALCLALAACASSLVQGDGVNSATPVEFRKVRGRLSSSLLGIVRGTTSEVGQFPYMAAVFPDFSSFCGGSLISKKWVLTAGHCVSGEEYWIVYLGAWKMLMPKESTRTAHVTPYAYLHPDYEFPKIDIALLELVTAATYTDNINPVALSNIAPSTLVNKSATISGWGLVSDSVDVISPVLKYTSLTVKNTSYCDKYYGLDLGDGIICLQGSNLEATCEGDSGGPLVYTKDDGELVQIGATSFGSSAGCETGAPDGFSNIAYFLTWIEETVGEKLS